nr:ATP-binding protein [Lachnospiraceae bacterium]
YATSNRRHLLKETFSDRDHDEDDIHRSDTVAERLSLSGRFGVSIAYFRPERQTFYDIVTSLAAKYENITLSREELIAEADKWALRRGGLSGRVAQQFVDHLAAQ